MSIKWKFKIDFDNEKIWKKIEIMSEKKVPEEFKRFIRDYNAACPDSDTILINKSERVFDSVLSFNDKEIDAETFDSVYKSMRITSMIPFARDSFGNYYCYSLFSHTVAFYHHEEDVYENTNYSLEEFLSKLY